MNALGKHCLLDYFGCDARVLDDRDRLREILLRAVRRSGATIVTDVFHQFSPHGLSGVVVIAESHVAIHTWPEHGCASVDIFSCSEKMDVGLIEEELRKAFGAQSVSTQVLERGRIPVPASPAGSFAEVTRPAN